MKRIIKKIRSAVFTFFCLRTPLHGRNCKCNSVCLFTRKTSIGNDCHFNGCSIKGNGKVTIGDHFHSGEKMKILTTFHNYDKGNALPYDSTSYDRDIVIEDNVWIGDNVLILGGVTIGEGSVVQAGSVVCKNIPRLSISGGHPAVPFKYRDKEHYYELKSKQDKQV